MSSGSVSDTGDVAEGEGPKMVQSSFREPSIMGKSVIKEPEKEKKVEIKEDKKENSDAPEKAQETGTKPKIVGKSSGKKGKVSDHFNFDIPKMHGIPILNKDTANPNTFDLNYLLNPEVQKIAQSGHRLTQSTTISAGKIPTSPKNHIQKNILNSKKYSASKSNKELPQAEIPEIIVKKGKLDVEGRFYDKAKKTEEKIKVLKSLKDIQEVNGCTFKPQIKGKREAKTYDEFYNYMKNFADKKDKKIKILQEEEAKTLEKSLDFSHQPKLCEKSIQMIARKSDVEDSTFARLHKLYKSPKSMASGRESFASEAKTEENSNNFRPTVNKKSQMLNRADPVAKILYDDALRRINKEKNPPLPQAIKFITNKSEKVLIEKVKRDFEEAFCCIEPDRFGGLNYTKMIELFKLLYLIKDEHKKEEERLLLLESWKILACEGENSCKKESLVVFILALMGFYEDWMGFTEGERLSLGSYEANKIHLKFDLFYSNRISVVNRSTVNKSYKASYEYSFHPQTIAESQVLAQTWREQNRTGGKIEDMLIAGKAKTEKKLEEKRAILEEELLEECSFQPIIEQMPDEFRVYGLYDREDLTSEYFKLLNNPNSQYTHKGLLLHDLSKISKQRKLTKANEVLQEKLDKELENCTFAPKLEERLFPQEYSIPEPKSEEKPKKVLVKKEPSKAESKLAAYQNLKDLAEKEVEKPKVQKKDKLEITVQSNDGKTAVLCINLPSGSEKLEFDVVKDDPAFKVMEFTKKHGLKKEEEYSLVKELTLLKS